MGAREPLRDRHRAQRCQEVREKEGVGRDGEREDDPRVVEERGDEEQSDQRHRDARRDERVLAAWPVQAKD